MKITVETQVNAAVDKVWSAYLTPADIMQWNAASDDWHTTKSSVDLRVGGAFIFLTPNLHSPVTQMNRLLKPLQSVLVPRLYGRAEADTFPVVYRANTVRRLQTLAAAGSMTLEACRIIADPSYLAFNEVLFSASVMLTRLLPVDAGVHLVGVCVKQ